MGHRRHRLRSVRTSCSRPIREYDNTLATPRLSLSPRAGFAGSRHSTQTLAMSKSLPTRLPTPRSSSPRRGGIEYRILVSYPSHQLLAQVLTALTPALPSFATAKDLISGLLEKDPTKRLTAEQMLEHEWMVNPATEVAYHDTEHVGFPFHQNRNSEIFIQIINKYAPPCPPVQHRGCSFLTVPRSSEPSSTVVSWKRKSWRSSSKRPGTLYRQAVR